MSDWKFDPMEISESVREICFIEKGSAKENFYLYFNLNFFLVFISFLCILFHISYKDYFLILLQLIFICVNLYFGALSSLKKKRLLDSSRNMLNIYFDWVSVTGKLLALEELGDKLKEAKGDKQKIECLALQLEEILSEENYGRENEVDGKS